VRSIESSTTLDLPSSLSPQRKVVKDAGAESIKPCRS